jgi:4-diphosphocytidyl-2-C-methyl-D-erythritol kinase
MTRTLARATWRQFASVPRIATRRRAMSTVDAVVSAPAKINLFLEVLRRREDGYHDLVTCMVPVTLADTLSFFPTDHFSLTCDDPTLDVGPSNLVWRATELLRQETGGSAGVAMHLNKRIPIQAGLGGGSSDAAATLRALNTLWNLRLSHERLLELAAQLGSDVPFFLHDGPAWCAGRGERIAPFALPTELFFVLLKPAVGLNTASVYRQVHVPAQPRSSEAMRRALTQGDAAAIGAALFNRLQPAAECLCPEVTALRHWIETDVPPELYWGHVMSGSGSSYIVLCRDEACTRRLINMLEDASDCSAPGIGAGLRFWSVRSVPGGADASPGQSW